MKKRISTLLLAALVFLCSAASGEEMDSIVRMLHDELSQEQRIASTLNMEHPFAPVVTDGAYLTQENEPLLRALGLEKEAINAVTHRGSRWTGQDGDGRTITVAFGGAYGDTAAVFQTEEAGGTVLLDVLDGVSGGNDICEIVELRSGRYLLANGWGHGTGTGRDWTYWYNLDSRRMELCVLRSGYESYGQIAARAVTHTNADHALDVNGYDMPDPLITYTYTSVYTKEDHAFGAMTLLDEDCTVRIYHLSDGGMRLAGERVYDDCPPALIEQLSEQEMLDTRWGLGDMQEETLDTAGLSDLRGPDYAAMISAMAAALPQATVINAPGFVHLRQAGDKESPLAGRGACGRHGLCDQRKQRI